MRYASAIVIVLLTISFLSATAESSAAESPAADGWSPLWNGKDLAGWETYIAPPEGKKEPVGLNKDPQGVFKVVEVDGAPAIRVSGESYGTLATLEELESYHIRLEFKWGEKRWPPRANVGRDSGILYNSIGPHGVGSGAWMKSIECNIMEKGTGQWWSVAGAVCDVEGERVDASNEARVPYKMEGPGEHIIVHKKGGERFTASAGDGVTPAVDPEKPRGEWNTVEVISMGSTGIHIVNGVVNLVLTNARFVEGGKVIPLTKGKIQLQSEGAEVFYRKIEVRPIHSLPPEIAEATKVAPVDDEGFTRLLDPALKSQWAQCGPGGFRIDNDVATPFGGMGLFWFKGRDFENFILKGEYQQVDDGADSGVFIRFPDPANDPWNAVNKGYEIELGENRVFDGGTGSIYSFHAPTELPVRPAGQWNEYEITCIGQEHSVRLNGKLINRYTGSRGLRGFVGLQNYNDGKRFLHRGTRIRELPADASSYHVLIDAGVKDFKTGWKQCGPGGFDIADGLLHTQGGMGLLWNERPFQDFILLVDWKTSKHNDNAGVFVRFPDPGNDPWDAVNKGYEIQVDDSTPEPERRTASVYSFQTAADGASKGPGVWNHYEIEVRGQQYIVRLNGRRVNEYEGKRALRGFVGLQNHDAGSKVTFRDLRVVEIGSK